MSELRWNPLQGEWVITAVHRQERPVLEECPFCTGAEENQAVPEAVAIPNKYPALSHPPPDPVIETTGPMRVEPSAGICEVLLYTSSHDRELPYLPVERAVDVLRLWADRFEDLEARPYIQYVLIFENRGQEVGVTLSHPHGQLYAYPFVPPVIQREVEALRAHRGSRGVCLLCEVLDLERRAGTRLVASEEGYIALVPFWARWPYEVHILPERHVTALTELSDDEVLSQAMLIRKVLQKYDNLVDGRMPYVMVVHQRPTDGKPHDYFHMHVEVYPLKRSPAALKYLAGCELGAGVFLNDSHPEEKAEELRRTAPL
jgi:UDPglucose--hexose-1-phosphate uridylyltransferase